MHEFLPVHSKAGCADQGRKLCNFRDLNRQRTEADPAPGAVYAVTDSRNKNGDQKQYGDDDENPRNTLPKAHGDTVDDAACDRGNRNGNQMPHEKVRVARVKLRAVGERNRGRIHHQGTESKQKPRDKKDAPVDTLGTDTLGTAPCLQHRGAA